ncbi:MAG: DUF1667 domain-containing protein [Velocimicrobium sp.]
MEQTLICIGCPLGCLIRVELEEGKIKTISGNTCKRGEIYARKEIIAPMRIVTTTVRVEGGNMKMIPVKTKGDVPKSKIGEVMDALKGFVVKAPIYIGDVIIQNVAGTGVDVVATKQVQ